MASSLDKDLLENIDHSHDRVVICSSGCRRLKVDGICGKSATLDFETVRHIFLSLFATHGVGLCEIRPDSQSCPSLIRVRARQPLLLSSIKFLDKDIVILARSPCCAEALLQAQERLVICADCVLGEHGLAYQV